MARYGKISPLRLTIIHFALWVACFIATFPVLRVVSISFRNTGTISSVSQTGFPPRGEATFRDYFKFFADAIVPYEIIDAIRGTSAENEITVKEDQGNPPESIAPSSKYVASESEFGEDKELWSDFAELDLKSEVSQSHKWYSNYVSLFKEYPFLQWIYNSLIISLSSAFIGVFLAATSAYGFARFNFPGKRAAVGFLFTTQMIPAPMMIIPVYLVIKSINLGNTYAGLVIAMSVTSLPFSIMVLKGYFDTVPKSLEEAARVDGCSPVSAFFRILLPLSTPALAIAFLFSFTTAWSEFLLASTLIDDVELRPWTLGLMAFSGNFDARWGLFAAGSVVIAIPTMMLFLYSSKYVISGLTIGGVKG